MFGLYVLYKKMKKFNKYNSYLMKTKKKQRISEYVNNGFSCLRTHKPCLNISSKTPISSCLRRYSDCFKRFTSKLLNK